MVSRAELGATRQLAQVLSAENNVNSILAGAAGAAGAAGDRIAAEEPDTDCCQDAAWVEAGGLTVEQWSARRVSHCG